MNFFSKVKGSVMKAAASAQHMAASVSETVSHTATSALTTIAQQTQKTALTSGSSSSSSQSPAEELMYLFRECCTIIDALADTDENESGESDKRLYESKVRPNLRAMINLLQSESDRWLAKYSESPDPEITDLPCLDTFLRMHMMQELCTRAMRDMPRGCLPLVLGCTALLLRNVKYPLLPHVTVYKPIANLISVACRYEAMNNASATTTASSSAWSFSSPTTQQLSKSDLASYKKRIDIDLTNLISTLWRKIAENPPLLEFFTLFDRRPNVIEGLQVSLHAQMDILTALITLMYKPRVSGFARRALLTALAMHDRRIDMFVCVHTDLVEVCVHDVCKTFANALESVCVDKELLAHIANNTYYITPKQQTISATTTTTQQQAASTTPAQSHVHSQPATTSLLRAAQANSQLNASSHAGGPIVGAGNHNMVLSAAGHSTYALESAASIALDAFLTSIKFLDTLIQTCTSLQEVYEAALEAELNEMEKRPSAFSPRAQSSQKLRRKRSISSPQTPFSKYLETHTQLHLQTQTQTPLKLKLLTEYYHFFLQTNVRIALCSKEETQALAFNVCMRRVLHELHTPHGAQSRELLKLTTAYLSCHHMTVTASSSTALAQQTQIHGSQVSAASTHSAGSSTHSYSLPQSSMHLQSQTNQAQSSQTQTQTSLSLALITRALSVSRPLSVSSMQTIHDVLDVSPLTHAVVLFTKASPAASTQGTGSSSSAQQAIQALTTGGDGDSEGGASAAPQTPHKPQLTHTLTHTQSSFGLGLGAANHLQQFLSGELNKRPSSTGSSQSQSQATAQPQSTVQAGNATPHFLALSAAITSCQSQSQTRSIDSRLAHICALLSTAHASPTHQTQTQAQVDDDPTIEKGRGLGLDKQHALAASEGILARIAERLVSVDPLFSAHVNKQFEAEVLEALEAEAFAQHTYTNTLSAGLAAVRSSDLLCLVARKLSVFLTLKPEDQSVVRDLVSACIRVLCAVTVLYDDSYTYTNVQQLQHQHHLPNGLGSSLGHFYLTNQLPTLSRAQGLTPAATPALVGGGGGGGAGGDVDHSVHSYVDINNSNNTGTQTPTIAASHLLEQTLHTQLFVEHSVGFQNPNTCAQIQQLSQATANVHSHFDLQDGVDSTPPPMLPSRNNTHGAALMPNFDPLDVLCDLLLCAEKVWVDLRPHTQRIQDFGVKFCATRHLMHANAINQSHKLAHMHAQQSSSSSLNVSSHNQPQAHSQPHKVRVDPVLKRLIEKETPQARRILESAVMAREMLADARGALLATKQLRTALMGGPRAVGADYSSSVQQQQGGFGSSTNNYNDDLYDSWGEAVAPSTPAPAITSPATAVANAPTTPFPQLTPAACLITPNSVHTPGTGASSGSSSWQYSGEETMVVEEEDLWERAEELEAKRKAAAAADEVGWGIGVDISEDDFLQDCSELENGLDQLLRQQ